MIHTWCRSGQGSWRRRSSASSSLARGFGPFSPGFGLLAGFSLRCGEGFGLLAGLVLTVGSVPLVSEPGDVPSGGRVVPAELGVLPAEVQVQNRAVALMGTVVDPFDGDGLVQAFNEPVPGQGGAVVPAPGVVKAPVFRDAQGGVAIPLFDDVPAAGGGRGNFQNEVRGLALLLDDVAVAVTTGFGVDVEGDEQVRVEQAQTVGGRYPADVGVARYDGGVLVAEVLGPSGECCPGCAGRCGCSCPRAQEGPGAGRNRWLGQHGRLDWWSCWASWVG